MPRLIQRPQTLPPHRSRTGASRSTPSRAAVVALALLLGTTWTSSAFGQLVVNEVDYDQPGTDSSEFIEVMNAGNLAIDLTDHRIDLINGATGKRYDSIDLPSIILPPESYFTLCTDKTHVAQCDLEVTPAFHLIENGAPDAVAIVVGGSILDTVSYEGDTPGYTEGRGTTIEDDPARTRLGLSRFPDGSDSDRNDFDFILSCASPGEPNLVYSEGCGPDGLEMMVTGDCPGSVLLHLEGGSYGGSGGLLAAETLGSDPIAGGPCSGLGSGLAQPVLATTFVFDTAGIYEFERQAQANQCGWYLRAVDLSTCELSDIAAVGQ